MTIIIALINFTALNDQNLDAFQNAESTIDSPLTLLTMMTIFWRTKIIGGVHTYGIYIFNHFICARKWI